MSADDERIVQVSGYSANAEKRSTLSIQRSAFSTQHSAKHQRDALLLNRDSPENQNTGERLSADC
jgi:hypothetical protein